MKQSPRDEQKEQMVRNIMHLFAQKGWEGVRVIPLGRDQYIVMMGSSGVEVKRAAQILRRYEEVKVLEVSEVGVVVTDRPELSAPIEILNLPFPPATFEYAGEVYEYGTGSGESLWDMTRGATDHMLLQWSTRNLEGPSKEVTVKFKRVGWQIVPAEVVQA